MRQPPTVPKLDGLNNCGRALRGLRVDIMGEKNPDFVTGEAVKFGQPWAPRSIPAKQWVPLMHPQTSLAQMGGKVKRSPGISNGQAGWWSDNPPREP